MKVGVTGCTGKMGKEIINEIFNTPSCLLAGAITRADNIFLGKDVSHLIGIEPTGIVIGDNLETLCQISDAIIDFSSVGNSLKLAEINLLYKKPLIIGTTGLTNTDKSILRNYSNSYPMLVSSNMSLGVNLLIKLVTDATLILTDQDFDIELLEMHHREKKDAPSGTSLMLGQAIARQRQLSLPNDAIFTRDGIIGPRPKDKIGFATLRGGDVVGDHTVIFAGAGERIELTHKASNRSIYAKGALKAAFWLSTQSQGLYDMQDVIAL